MATNNNDNLKTTTKRTRTQEQYEELEEEHQGKKQRSVGKVEQQVFAVINDKSRLYVSGTFLGDRIISFFELVQLGSEVALCYVLGQMVIEPLNFCSDPRMISYAFEYVFRIARIMHPDFIPADVLAKEERVLTLLGACCTYNRPDILRLLLECGANANFKEYVNGQFIDSEKKRPIHICSYYGYIECLKILLLHKADFTIEHNRFRPIVICAFRGFTEGIKALVAAGEDINFVSDHGKTVLGYLVQRNHTEALREILKINGVNVHVGMKKTPIIDACRGDNLVCLKLLLDNGGDINYTNDGRCRHALFTAIRYDSKKVSRYLISRSDLDTNVVDSMGRSPIIRSIKADAPNAFWLLFRKHHDATSDAVIAFYSLSQRCRKERINLSMQSVLRSE